MYSSISHEYEEFVLGLGIEILISSLNRLCKKYGLDGHKLIEKHVLKPTDSGGKEFKIEIYFDGTGNTCLKTMKMDLYLDYEDRGEVESGNDLDRFSLILNITHVNLIPTHESFSPRYIGLSLENFPKLKIREDRRLMLFDQRIERFFKGNYELKIC